MDDLTTGPSAPLNTTQYLLTFNSNEQKHVRGWQNATSIRPSVATAASHPQRRPGEAAICSCYTKPQLAKILHQSTSPAESGGENSTAVGFRAGII